MLTVMAEGSFRWNMVEVWTQFTHCCYGSYILETGKVLAVDTARIHYQICA
jgi:hypothetical protein